MDNYKFRETMVVDGIRHHTIGNDTYFYVDDIRAKYASDTVRVMDSLIEHIEIEGENVPLIRWDKIDIISDFDRMMLRARNKPK